MLILRRLSLLALCLFFLAACGDAVEDENARSTSDELSGRIDPGDRDRGDKEYVACGEDSCGETCTICSPRDPDCIETAVVKFCDADGKCNAGVQPICDDDGGDDEVYEPCGEDSCGETCTICSPNDPDCIETAVVKFCDADGKCNAGLAPTCDDDGGDDDDDAEEPYEPCGEDSCGEPCTICPPNAPDCYETTVLKFCNADGQCNAGLPPTCDEKPYDPCDGKSCGDSCSICPPNTPDCYETTVLKYCNLQGRCSAQMPVCMGI